MSKENKIKKFSELVDKYKNISVVSEIESNISKIKPTQININNIIIDDIYDINLYDLSLYTKLEKSIINEGILNPIILINNNVLISGIKRYLIAKKNSINNIPCFIISLDEKKKYQFIVENIFSNSADCILIKTKCLDYLTSSHIFNDNELLKITNMSISNYKNIKRLNNLPDYIKKGLINNTISYGKARSLLNLEEDEQKKLYELIVSTKKSVRDIEKIKSIYIGSRKKKDIKLNNNKIIITFSDEEEAKKNYSRLKKYYSND